MTLFPTRSLPLAALLSTCVAAQNRPVLEVGSEAPALRELSWVVGEPVEIETGRVVVVEFWATWCPVCRASIPVLSKLQRRNEESGVRVVGIASARFEKTRARIEQFVADWRPRIGYSIAWDGGQTAAADWLDASRQRGLPVTFVVDRQRRVAWIGTPLDGLADVLAHIERGTFDIEAARKVSQLQKELAKAAVRNDKETILDVTSRWIEVEPQRATPWISRFRVLNDDVADAGAALACAREALSRLADAPGELARFANEGLFAAPAAAACHRVGLEAIRAAVELRCDDPQLAMAYFSALAATGNDAEAEKAADRAVDLAKSDAATLLSLAGGFADARHGKRFARQALRALRLAIELEPENHALDRAEFDVLATVVKDDAAARAVGARLVRKAELDDLFLNDFAWSLLDSPSYRGRFDALALAASEIVHARTKGANWMYVDTLARAKFVNGFLEEALALQRRAVDECEMLRYLGELQGRLKVYEKAVAEKRK